MLSVLLAMIKMYFFNAQIKHSCVAETALCNAWSSFNLKVGVGKDTQVFRLGTSWDRRDGLRVYNVFLKKIQNRGKEREESLHSIEQQFSTGLESMDGKHCSRYQWESSVFTLTLSCIPHGAKQNSPPMSTTHNSFSNRYKVFNCDAFFLLEGYKKSQPAEGHCMTSHS